MAEKKSILEEALLDVKNIQSALNANTKEILRSVAREEINSVVKESLMKNEEFEEEDLESPEGETELGGVADAAAADVNPMGDEESDDELGNVGSDEVAPMGLDNGMDSELGDEEELGGEELGDEPMDMTGASDDDVLAIYKKLSGEDEIEIVGDEIHLNVTEPGEYIVTKGGKSPVSAAPEAPIEEPIDGEEELEAPEGEEETEYEIEMGDEDGEEEEAEESEETEELEAPEGEEETEESEESEESEEEEEEEEEEELNEAIPVGLTQSKRIPGKANIGQPHGAGAEKLDESVNKKVIVEVKQKYNNLLTESKKLKSENEEFRKALKVFRNQLVETVVFNSNLTYATRLFMEHSTTKAEKENIIKRFDNEVSNLVESKKLYKTIASELENRKPINESVDNKITKTVSTSTSKQLNESTAYVDPSTKRIKDLINRVEKR